MLVDNKATDKDQRGQTLVEILAALVLLVLLAGSVLAIFSPTARWIAEAGQQTRAGNYAVAILESLRSCPELLDEANQGQSAQQLELMGLTYLEGTTNTITRLEPRTDYPNLYDVTVMIQWIQGDNTRSLEMGTVIRKSGR